MENDCLTAEEFRAELRSIRDRLAAVRGGIGLSKKEAAAMLLGHANGEKALDDLDALNEEIRVVSQRCERLRAKLNLPSSSESDPSG